MDPGEPEADQGQVLVQRERDRPVGDRVQQSRGEEKPVDDGPRDRQVGEEGEEAGSVPGELVLLGDCRRDERLDGAGRCCPQNEPDTDKEQAPTGKADTRVKTLVADGTSRARGSRKRRRRPRGCVHAASHRDVWGRANDSPRAVRTTAPRAPIRSR